jgi:hypothetical protein
VHIVVLHLRFLFMGFGTFCFVCTRCCCNSLCVCNVIDDCRKRMAVEEDMVERE